MITIIRRQFKSSAYRSLLLIVVFAIVLGLISLPTLIRQSAAGGPWAIRVNKQEISYQSFMREVAEQRDRISAFRAQFGQFADMLLQSMGMSLDPKSLAFDVLVKEELINQFADQIGLYLHPDFIAQNIGDADFARKHLGDLVPPFLYDQSGVLNMRTLRMYLQRSGLSIKAFERRVERLLARQQIIELVGAMGYVPEFDLKQQYIVDKVGKKFSVLTFSFDQFLKQERAKGVSDEKLKAFFDKENRQLKRYWVPEKRSGIIWKFEPRNYGISISDEEIKSYYEDHKVKSYVDEPTRVSVRQMKQPAEGGVNLSEIRAELIADSSSEWAEEWEEIAPFARGDKERTFERTAFLLRKEGDISSVIETDEGKMVLQLIKRIPRTYKSLTQVRNDIKSTLTLKKFKNRFVSDMKDIVQQDSEEKALVTFIAKKGGKQEQIDAIPKDESKLAKQIFTLKKNHLTFYVDGQTGVAIKLTEIKERHLPPLESIRNVVEGDLLEERAMETMQKQLQEAKKAAANQSFDELSTTFDVSLEKTGWLKADSKDVKNLEKRGWPVNVMLKLEHGGAVLAHETTRDGFLIRLDDFEPFNEEQFVAVRTEIKDKLKGMRARLYLEGFVASLYRNATIETNESIIIAGE